MKKQPGINGNYVLLDRDERMSSAALPTLVTLGTPAALQTLYAFSPDQGPVDWILPLVLWIYGLLFWFNSEGILLFRAKRWEWTDEAIEEQQRYMSDTRIASRRFWGKWWVRFPIGLLFLSVGIHAMFSKDFAAQWLSFILLMSAFVTPFVFIAELAMLPLAILIVLGFMAVVTLTPTSVIIMLAVLAMFFTVVMAQNVRARQPQKPLRKKQEEEKDKKDDEAAGDATDAGAPAAADAAALAAPGAVAVAEPPPTPSLADQAIAEARQSAAAREESVAAAAAEREASVAQARAAAEERMAAAQEAAAAAAEERQAAVEARRAERAQQASGESPADEAADPEENTADKPAAG